MGDKPLIVVAGGLSWGRATLGSILAVELAEHGARPHILYDSARSELFLHSRISSERLPIGPLLGLFIQETLTTFDPTSIILCDHRSVSQMLANSGVHRSLFDRATIPVLGIEHYDLSETGTVVDLFYDKMEEMPASLEGVVSVYSVPSVRISNGRNRFCSLPVKWSQATKSAETFLRFAGLPKGAKFTLITTAPWQHQHFRDRHALLVQMLLPRLIAEVVSSIPELHLVHIGPAPFAIRHVLAGRYHWIKQVSPANLESMLSSAAAYLSMSPIAVTQMRAILNRVPILLLQNSRSVPVADLPLVRKAHVASQTVFYPFSIWPLGYHAFLKNMLKRNQLMSAAKPQEVLDLRGFSQALDRLISDEQTRAKLMSRQADYVQEVRSMPKFADLIARLE